MSPKTKATNLQPFCMSSSFLELQVFLKQAWGKFWEESFLADSHKFRIEECVKIMLFQRIHLGIIFKVTLMGHFLDDSH